jgi:hypothetical protein
MLESPRFHFSHRLKCGEDWAVEIDPPQASCVAGPRERPAPVTFEHVSAILSHDETARVRASSLVDLLQHYAPFKFPISLRQKLLGRLASWIKARHPVVLPYPGRRGPSASIRSRI